MKAVFLNDFGRLRSGWRFSIFLCLFIFSSTLLGAGIITLLEGMPTGFDNKGLLFLVAGSLASFLCALWFGWFCGKLLEGLPIRALGWTFSNNWLKHLAWGVVFGSFSILLAAVIAYVFGGLRFQSNDAAGSAAILVTLSVSFVIFVIGSLSEETIFRGYMLQTFSRSKLAWFSIAMTSIFFATAHLNNPNVSWISSANTGLAGILFGVAYMKTRTLWFPFSVHLMWNWVQGAFLGITVSGLKELTTAPLLIPTDSGPAWLTGGAYGIEGGVACTIALIVTTALIWFSPFLKPTEEMLQLTDEENTSEKKKMS